jgi:hypothetical protein
MEVDERSGPPRSHGTNENVEKFWNLMHSDRHLSIRAVAVQLQLDKETVKRPELLHNDSILHHDGVTALKVLCQASSFWPKNHY